VTRRAELLSLVFAALPLLAPRRAMRVISTVLLAGMALLGLASIGLLLVPSAVAMGVAASNSPSGSDAPAGAAGR
jgi:hypothetical protein